MSNYLGIRTDDPTVSQITLTGNIYESVQDKLTALAGGGQAGATGINAQNARFTTVATAADSAMLPLSTPGLILTVTNASANSMNVFPRTGDIINALSANAAFAVAAGKTCTFTCFGPGQWHTLLSA